MLERSILVHIPLFSGENRLTQAELEQEFSQVYARVLGALMTALSKTLKQIPSTRPRHLPRMADFVRFAIAAETALDLPKGSFLKAYQENCQDSHQIALEASPVAIAVQQLMETQDMWQGTATDLLKELERLTEESTRRGKLWPKTARGLGKALARLAPNLRAIGIEVRSIKGTRGKSTIILEKSPGINATNATNATSTVSPLH